MSSIEPQTTSPVLSTARIHPPVLAAALLLGTLALHFVLPEARSVGWYQVIGLLLVAGGAGLACFAAALFQARNTTKNPYGEPAAFVAQPPYTWARNPMYLGITTTLLGMAVFFSSIVDVDRAGGLLRGDRSNGDSARGRNDGAALRSGLHRLPESGQTLALKLK